MKHKLTGPAIGLVALAFVWVQLARPWAWEPLSYENPQVVLDDADLNVAVELSVQSAFYSTGQRCTASSRLIVTDKIYPAFIEAMQKRMAAIKVGDALAAGIDIGPVISAAARARITRYIDEAEAAGAKVLVDGRGLKVAGHADGYFLGPCLFDNVKPGMVIYQEEIFGPVLGVVRVKTLQEAMDLIDAHEYGNGTCIFTRDGEAARYFTDNIQVGMVGVNVPLPVPVAYHSFGGWKRSLFGDLHAYGPDAVRFYTKRKTITQRWPSAGVREGTMFSFPSSK